MTWLLVAILGYLFFALASLGDKIVLKKAPKPKLYAFYVGVLSLLAVVFIPFIGFRLPSSGTWVWIFLDGVVYIWGLYVFFRALDKYEVSRVMPMVGAFQPIFIFILTWLFWPINQLSLSLADFSGFFLLFLGGMAISLEKNYQLTKDSFLLSSFASLLFSLDFIFLKFVLLEMPFLSGFVIVRVASAFFALFFLFDKQVRKDVFGSKKQKQEVGPIFILAQAAGGLATILQSLAIALVPVAFLAIVNALKGVQYVFLFVLTVLFSYHLPAFLKETLSRKVLMQKLVAILIIGLGLAVLVLYGSNPGN
ncbi:MAG: hypothetical protein PHW71_01645 [Candidatus Pacebacteria bacterium]|nr:hypothetical protein [Candidatus Paceibacterota bacterium]MDD5555451.1 hypothetical protein [Candidatus Paceibacterota bacterium]